MKDTTALLTLGTVAAKPEAVTGQLVLQTGEEMVFRPLKPDDEVGLADFLQRLSPQTRKFSTYPGYDLATARGMCEAIDRYDKLRMVAVVGLRVVALFEFSFGIVDSDRNRYRGYGIELDESTDCRFGPCISDEYQDKGLGSKLLAHVTDIARRFGKRRIILWGGVLADNHRAIHYYEKNGFYMLGRFRDDLGSEFFDGMFSLPERETEASR